MMPPAESQSLVKTLRIFISSPGMDVAEERDKARQVILSVVFLRHPPQKPLSRKIRFPISNITRANLTWRS